MEIVGAHRRAIERDSTGVPRLDFRSSGAPSLCSFASANRVTLHRAPPAAAAAAAAARRRSLPPPAPQLTDRCGLAGDATEHPVPSLPLPWRGLTRARSSGRGESKLDFGVLVVGPQVRARARHGCPISQSATDLSAVVASHPFNESVSGLGPRARTCVQLQQQRLQRPRQSSDSCRARVEPLVR
jgi:hypothetical protein